MKHCSIFTFLLISLFLLTQTETARVDHIDKYISLRNIKQPSTLIQTQQSKSLIPPTKKQQSMSIDKKKDNSLHFTPIKSQLQIRTIQEPEYPEKIAKCQRLQNLQIMISHATIPFSSKFLERILTIFRKDAIAITKNHPNTFYCCFSVISSFACQVKQLTIENILSIKEQMVDGIDANLSALKSIYYAIKLPQVDTDLKVAKTHLNHAIDHMDADYDLFTDGPFLSNPSSFEKDVYDAILTFSKIDLAFKKVYVYLMKVIKKPVNNKFISQEIIRKMNKVYLNFNDFSQNSKMFISFYPLFLRIKMYDEFIAKNIDQYKFISQKPRNLLERNNQQNGLENIKNKLLDLINKPIENNLNIPFKTDGDKVIGATGVAFLANSALQHFSNKNKVARKARKLKAKSELRQFVISNMTHMNSKLRFLNLKMGNAEKRIHDLSDLIGHTIESKSIYDEEAPSVLT